mgnify:CR=1 FL=1
MGWTNELENLVPLALVLGLGFGIVFLILGSFASQVQTSSPTAYNGIQAVMNAFLNPIQQYLGLIIIILFLIIMFVIAMWGMKRAKH